MFQRARTVTSTNLSPVGYKLVIMRTVAPIFISWYEVYSFCLQEAVKLDGAIFGGLLEKLIPHVAKHMVGSWQSDNTSTEHCPSNTSGLIRHQVVYIVLVGESAYFFESY